MRPFICLLTTLLSIACTQTPQSDNSSSDHKESFNLFARRFCSDSSFQFERISFPLEKVITNETTGSESIEKEEWQYTELYCSDGEYLIGVYNDEAAIDEVQKDETDNKVIYISGYGTGLSLYYFFKRVEGKWFLISIRDSSN